MNIVPATAEMVRAYCQVSGSARALAVVDGERVLGVVGLCAMGNGQIMFTHISEELKKTPRVIVRAWRAIKAMTGRLPTFAECDRTIPKAADFLIHLGFVPYNDKLWRLQ